jgi:hypothetical protein
MPINPRDIKIAMESARRGGMRKERPSKYQPLAQVNREKPGVGYDNRRMAGEAIPEGLEPLLEEIRREGLEAEDSAMADAVEYMTRRNAIDAEYGLAGLSKQQARSTSDLGSLLGGKVPAAYIDNPSQGVERRVHTRYEVNPVTGEQDVVAYLDPGTGNPLTTNYGDSRFADIDLGGYHKASEYVQDRAMRLMGLNPQRNNSANVTDVDFMVKGMGVDGEIREDFETKNRNLPVQVYTKTTTPATKGGDKREVAQAVRREIVNELRSRGGNVMEAVERAGNSGKITDIYEGKALKPDIQRILMTSLNTEDALRNKAARDKISIAPSNIRVIDMENAYNYIDQMTPDQILKNSGTGRETLQVRGNTGDPNSRNREARGRVYIRIPESAEGVSYVAGTPNRFPHVAQLY